MGCHWQHGLWGQRLSQRLSLLKIGGLEPFGAPVGYR
jgi:hypothetical protein